MQEKIENLIKRYERQLKRCQERESDLKAREENLSVHGYWDLGYFGGKTSLYEDVIDELKEVLSQHTETGETK